MTDWNVYSVAGAFPENRESARRAGALTRPAVVFQAASADGAIKRMLDDPDYSDGLKAGDLVVVQPVSELRQSAAGGRPPGCHDAKTLWVFVLEDPEPLPRQPLVAKRVGH